jgi:hypothetical protein
MGYFFGLVQIEQPLRSTVLTRYSTGAPTDSQTPPAYRVYGPSGIMQAGTGTLLFKDPGAAGGGITGASNASPIVITSPAHGLSTGANVTISGVLGNVAANGSWTVTVIDPNTFSLNGSAGSGAWTSGGTWHVSGLYDVNFTPSAANGFVSGQCYSMLVSYTIAGVALADDFTFMVV